MAISGAKRAIKKHQRKNKLERAIRRRKAERDQCKADAAS